jgi:phenylalanyl-tRNA synthetase beta chain
MPRQWGSVERSADFFDLKGDLEAILAMTGADVEFSFRPATHPALHPGQCAQILCGRKRVGFIGKLSPAKRERFDIDTEVYLFEIDLGELGRTTLPSFNEISRFPSIQRDLALVVDEEVTVGSVLRVVRVSAGDLLHKLELIDVYKGKNLEKYKKSLAFSLTFQSESSNLTSLEVDTLTEKIIEVLKCELGAQLRS